jgi:hypothetical protein
MTPTIHILTPCARPQLLHALLSSIYFAQFYDFSVRWHILFKSKNDKGKGIDATNETLDGIPKTADHWVYWMCDDNMVHPAFFKRCSEVMTDPKVKGIVCAIERHDNPGLFIPGQPEFIYPGMIDAAQCLIRMDLVGDERIDLSLVSDGVFITNCYKKDPDSFVFLNEVLSFYEATFWNVLGGEKSGKYIHEAVAQEYLDNKALKTKSPSDLGERG